MDDDYSEREHDEGENAKEDRYVLVVGFTKEATYQFLRVRQHKDDSIYIEFAYRGNRVPHYSYHPNGEIHTVYFSDKGERIVTESKKGPPLSELHGQHNLGVWVVVSPTFPIWRKLTVENERKTQAILCFDMSRLTGLTGQLSVNLVLLESGRVDLLSNMAREIPADLNPQFIVVTATNPWIVIRAMPV